jgi:hypothetical protein
MRSRVKPVMAASTLHIHARLDTTMTRIHGQIIAMCGSIDHVKPVQGEDNPQQIASWKSLSLDLLLHLSLYSDHPRSSQSQSCLHLTWRPQNLHRSLLHRHQMPLSSRNPSFHFGNPRRHIPGPHPQCPTAPDTKTTIPSGATYPHLNPEPHHHEDLAHNVGATDPTNTACHHATTAI